MRYSSRYRVKFDAGHRYTVIVTFEREGYAETDRDEWERIVPLVDALASELRNRQLDKMLGAHHPSVYGVAAFFMDRLALNAPVIEVEVRESDGPSAIIARPPEL